MNQWKSFIKYFCVFVFSFSVYAHGVIESPPSREQFCGVESKPDEIYKDKMTHEKCRPIMTNPDGSLNNSVYNFMAVLTHNIGRSNLPIDQLPVHVCGFNSEMWGGGKTPWDSAIDWPTAQIGSGEQKFIWNISWGNHFGDTEEFVYWITKPDFQFDPTKELTWNDFETTPFCKLNYNDQTPNANPNIIPDKVNNRFTTICNVPARQNRAVIYGEWGRNKSTYERFHSCIDVVFSTDNTPTINAVIKPIPAQITGPAEIDLDGSQSTGTNLSYNWSIDADNLAPYQLTNSTTSKAHLSIGEINAQQPVTVNLTINQGEAVDHASITFTHLTTNNATWQLVGKATVASTLKSGDGIQLRLIDKSGKDYFIPSTPVVLDENSAKPENWAYTLAQSTNTNNNFSAKIGVLAADSKTIEPVRSPVDNQIYVPVDSSIINGYIHIIPSDGPIQTCNAKRKDGSSIYWLGYDIYTDKTPFVLNFSATGIDLTKIIIASGVFSNIKVLDKDRLWVGTKPDWVSKTVPGYMGFHGPNYGSYDPFGNLTPANCQSSTISK